MWQRIYSFATFNGKMQQQEDDYNIQQLWRHMGLLSIVHRHTSRCRHLFRGVISSKCACCHQELLRRAGVIPLEPPTISWSLREVAMLMHHAWVDRMQAYVLFRLDEDARSQISAFPIKKSTQSINSLLRFEGVVELQILESGRARDVHTPTVGPWRLPSRCRLDLERTDSVGQLLKDCAQGSAVRTQ